MRSKILSTLSLALLGASVGVVARYIDVVASNIEWDVAGANIDYALTLTILLGVSALIVLAASNNAPSIFWTQALIATLWISFWAAWSLSQTYVWADFGNTILWFWPAIAAIGLALQFPAWIVRRDRQRSISA